MTDKHDEGKNKTESGATGKLPADASKAPGAVPPKKDAKKPRPNAGGGRPLIVLLSLLALLIALGTLGAGALLYREMQLLQSQRDELSDRLQRLDAALQSRPTAQAIEQLRGTVETLGSNLKEAQAQVEHQAANSEQTVSRVEERLDTISTEQDMLQKAIANLRDVRGRDDTAWRLAEVEHLLRIANYRVRLENDLEGGILALEAADAQLRELGDPAALPVRSAIAKEITQLRNVHRPDLPGIALRLQAAAAQVPALGPGKPPVPPPSAAAATSKEPSSGEPSTLTARLWRWLGSLVSITRQETAGELAPKPGITKARLAVEADLAFARSALLDHDPVAYHQRLESALKTLSDNFDTEDTAVANLRSELDSLRAAQLSIQLPNLGESLAALQRYLSERQHSTSGADSESSTEKAPVSHSE